MSTKLYYIEAEKTARWLRAFVALAEDWLGFSSQHPHGDSWLSVTLGGLTFSSGFHRCGMHTYMQTLTHINLFKMLLCKCLFNIMSVQKCAMGICGGGVMAAEFLPSFLFLVYIPPGFKKKRKQKDFFFGKFQARYRVAEAFSPSTWEPRFISLTSSPAWSIQPGLWRETRPQ